MNFDPPDDVLNQVANALAIMSVIASSDQGSTTSCYWKGDIKAEPFK